MRLSLYPGSATMLFGALLLISGMAAVPVDHASPHHSSLVRRNPVTPPPPPGQIPFSHQIGSAAGSRQLQGQESFKLPITVGKLIEDMKTFVISDEHKALVAQQEDSDSQKYQRTVKAAMVRIKNVREQQKYFGLVLLIYIRGALSADAWLIARLVMPKLVNHYRALKIDFSDQNRRALENTLENFAQVPKPLGELIKREEDIQAIMGHLLAIGTDKKPLVPAGQKMSTCYAFLLRQLRVRLVSVLRYYYGLSASMENLEESAMQLLPDAENVPLMLHLEKILLNSQKTPRSPLALPPILQVPQETHTPTAGTQRPGPNEQNRLPGIGSLTAN